METNQKSQPRRSHAWERQRGIRSDLIIPNPKLRLLDQVREVMRLKRYSIRTEGGYVTGFGATCHFTGCARGRGFNRGGAQD